MTEIVPAFVSTEVLKTFAEQRPEGLDRPAPRGADNGLQLGKTEFDGVEVGTVRREIDQRGARGLDRGSYAGDFVRAQVVEDHEIIGAERRHENLFHVRQEARAVECALKDAGRGQAGHAQRGEKRTGLPARKWDVVVDPHAPRGAPVAPQQIGGDPSFIEEHQVRGVPSRCVLPPVSARRHDVGPVVLTGPDGFF